MKTTIKQDQSFFNPYFFEGKQVQNIYFFTKEGIKANTKWFGRSNNEHPEIVFNFEIKRKLKPDFNLNHGFYLKNNERHFEGINIYLPLSKFNYEIKENVLNYKASLRTSYYDILNIELKSKAKLHRLNENNKLEYYIDDLKYNLIEVRYNHRSIDTKHGKKCRKLADEFNKVFNVENKISFYDVDRLLSNYKIIKIRK